MAYCDYRLCDICHEKAFYDANLNYDDGDKDYFGNELVKIKGSHLSLDSLGDWCVLCTECAKTHECVVVKKEAKREEDAK